MTSRVLNDTEKLCDAPPSFGKHQARLCHSMHMATDGSRVLLLVGLGGVAVVAVKAGRRAHIIEVACLLVLRSTNQLCCMLLALQVLLAHPPPSLQHWLQLVQGWVPRPTNGGRAAGGPVEGLPGLIGNTPLVRIKSLSEQTGCEV